MSRLHCPHCRASVLNNPNENGFLLCPECGQRFRPRADYDDFDDEAAPRRRRSSNATTWLIVGLVGGLLALVIVCGGGVWFLARTVSRAASEVREALEAAATEERAAREKAAPVTPEELVRAYVADEAAADRKYQGKYVRLTGVVAQVGTDPDGVEFITLQTGGAGPRVECYFDSDEVDVPPAPKLQRGQQVTLTGHCAGKDGNIHIRSCELVK